MHPARVISLETERLATTYARGFDRAPMLTVGVEEELLLVDRESLLPADAIDRALAGVDGDERFQPELRASQIELVTPVCMTIPDAHRELAAARARLVESLQGELGVLAVGTHPTAVGGNTVTARDRYADISDECRWALRRGQPCGLHVHVGVHGADRALAVFDAARSYLPELAALAANSPFFEGADSLLASTRLKLAEDFPRSGVPPAFATWREYARFVQWGTRSRLFSDPTYLWWDLRLRPDLGTIEFRVADAQTAPRDAAAIAAVCQTLVATLARRFDEGEELPAHDCHLIAENRWRAIRDGLDAELADLDTGAVRPARARLAGLVASLGEAAAELGCEDDLDQALRLVQEGGAQRQRRVVRREGLAALLPRLRAETERIEVVPSPPAGWAGEVVHALAAT